MTGNPYWNLNLGFAIPMALLAVALLGALAWLVGRRLPHRLKLPVGCIVLPLALVLNPCSGWIVLEPLNKHLLTEMKIKAERVGLEGKSFDEVHQLFGEPGFVWGTDDADIVTWNYPRPALYLFGSKFQVHFKHGAVYGWEPYDD